MRPNLKPVTKEKLKEEHWKVRLIAVIILISIGAAAFSYAIFSSLQTESGWVEITADSGSEGIWGDEFVFLYELGADDVSATREKKLLTLLYTRTSEQAYKIFNNDMGFEGINNVYELNHHPNEVLEVDKALYDAFSLFTSYNNRNLYLGPVYDRYNEIFYCNDDADTYDYDPYRNSDVALEYLDIIKYAGDSKQIELKLLGNNKVELFVSEEYMAYARDNQITEFIDFSWMRNAFVVDYLSDVMIENGYTHGTLSSYDGFSRNLDERKTEYSFNIYDRVGQNIYEAGIMKYSGKRSFVFFRDYRLTSRDDCHYYEFENGEIRTPYLDIDDGLCKSALPNLVAYSDNIGCAAILMEVCPVYIADDFESDNLDKLISSGIYSIYCDNYGIICNDKMVRFTELYDVDGVSYIFMK
ncbi:MAG: hypothetical protein ACI4EN_02035 [Butyrivibrio sp.]